jgi:hypothetical protein
MKTAVEQVTEQTIEAYKQRARLSQEERSIILRLAADAIGQLTLNPTQPARIDVPVAHKQPQMKTFAAIPWLLQVAVNRHFMETTGRGTNVELLEHVIAEKRDAGLCRMAFYGVGFARPRPVVERRVVYTGKNPEADHKKGLATKKQLLRRYGVEYHVETIMQMEPRGLLVRVWRGADWLTIKTAAFYPAEVARTFSQNLVALAITEPQAKRLQAGRTKGTTQTKAGARNRAAVIRKVYEEKKRANPDTKRGWLLDRVTEHFQSLAKAQKEYRNGYSRRTIEASTMGF